MQNVNYQNIQSSDAPPIETNWLEYTVKAMECTEVNPTLMHKNQLHEQLAESLGKLGFSVDFHAIGSFAMGTNIDNDSTIDYLMVLNSTLRNNETISSPTINDLSVLRILTKKYLKLKFPKALLDDSQPLAINISIPSLPGNFYYYFGMWQTNKPAFGNSPISQSLKLFNTEEICLIHADPFTVVTEINRKNSMTNGNTKNLIRALKKLKADSNNAITLTGHQIASIIYGMEEYTLAKSPGQLLFLLLEVSLHIKHIIDNPYVSKTLKSPDHSLLLNNLNSASFKHGIVNLKKAIDSLIKKLIMEIDLYQDIYENANR